MAEFCFDCYKKYFDESAKKENLVIDKEIYLCEGCREYKPTVVKVKSRFPIGRIREIIVDKVIRLMLK